MSAHSKRLGPLVALGVLFAATATTMVVDAAHAEPKEKVGVCHRTASESNRYVYIEVPEDQANGHITGTSSQHNQNITWPTDGTWRGVAHKAGDPVLDYFADSKEECSDTTPSPPEETEPSPTDEPTPTDEPSPTDEPTPTDEPSPTDEPTPSTPPVTPTETPSTPTTPTETPTTTVPPTTPTVPSAPETETPTPDDETPDAEEPQEPNHPGKPHKPGKGTHTATYCADGAWVTEVIRNGEVVSSTSSGTCTENDQNTQRAYSISETGL